MTKETAINYFRKPYRANGLDGRPSTLPRSGFVQRNSNSRSHVPEHIGKNPINLIFFTTYFGSP
jgi:hypothetical protein